MVPTGSCTMHRRRTLAPLALLALATALVAASCGVDGAETAGACSDLASLPDAPLIFVTTPEPGARVESGFTVAGCSRTFESNVPWRLLDAEGSELASGATTGGGVDGPGDFSFVVAYDVPEEQIGSLEVIEEDASAGESPTEPVRNVVPVILTP